MVHVLKGLQHSKNCFVVVVINSDNIITFVVVIVVVIIVDNDYNAIVNYLAMSGRNGRSTRLFDSSLFIEVVV